jgi:hypothetical protein
MGADWSRRRKARRLRALGACLVVMLGVGVSQPVVLAASTKNPKPGTSCAHPLFSGFAVDGSPSQKSDLKDFTVKFKLDSHNKSGESDESITFQAEVSITNPRLVMCRLVVNEFKGSGHSWPLTIGPHGGLSSQLTLGSGIAFGIAGYARLQ